MRRACLLLGFTASLKCLFLSFVSRFISLGHAGLAMVTLGGTWRQRTPQTGPMLRPKSSPITQSGSSRNCSGVWRSKTLLRQKALFVCLIFPSVLQSSGRGGFLEAIATGGCSLRIWDSDTPYFDASHISHNDQ